MKSRRPTRRDVLRLGAGVVGAGVFGPFRLPAVQAQEPPLPPPLPLLPRVNGAINVQPLRKLSLSDPGPDIVPGLVDLQMRAVYELGFEWIRVTISFSRFGANFLAAIPYVRAARALGINVLGLMSDFSGFDLVQALAKRTTRDQVTAAYAAIFDTDVVPASPAIAAPGAFALQVLNEPVHSLGITPESYVRDFLTPTYSSFKARDRDLLLVAAAEVGGSVGYLRTRTMLEVGLEKVCDGVAYHVYDPTILPRLRGLATRPVWVTESGVSGPDNHLHWVRDVFPEIRRTIADVEQIFYFDLYDPTPRSFRLVDIAPDGQGGFAALVESTALVEALVANVRQAAGEGPRAAYRDLVPDITAYFPTAGDIEIIAASGLVKS